MTAVPMLKLKLAPFSRLVWLGCALAYVGLRLARGGGHLPGPLAWQSTDLLCLPLVLGLVLALQRLGGRPGSWTLPRSHGLLAAIAYSAYFEGLLPRLTPHAVADPRDVAAYFAGWLLFELLLNRPLEKSRGPKAAA